MNSIYKVGIYGIFSLNSSLPIPFSSLILSFVSGVFEILSDLFKNIKLFVVYPQGTSSSKDFVFDI